MLSDIRFYGDINTLILVVLGWMDGRAGNMGTTYSLVHVKKLQITVKCKKNKFNFEVIELRNVFFLQNTVKYKFFSINTEAEKYGFNKFKN